MRGSDKITGVKLGQKRSPFSGITVTHASGFASSVEHVWRHLRTPLYANAYYLMANTALASVLGVVFWTVVARLYPPDEVGIASSTISAMTLLAGLAGLGFGIGLIRFLPGAGESSGVMLDSSLTFVALMAVILSIVFLVGLPLWSPALTLMYGHRPFLISFVASVMLFALNSLLGQVYVAYRAARLSLLSSTTMSVLKIPLVAVLAASGGAFAIFGSVGLATGAALGIGLVWFLPAVQRGYFPRPRLQAQSLHELLPYSAGNYAAVFLTQAPQLILPIMVLNVLGAAESAYAYMVWMIANLLFVISVAISTSALAEGSTDERMLGSFVRRALRLMLLLSVPAILAILVLGRVLLLLFGRAYAEEGAALLNVLALSALPVGVNNIYFAVKRVRKQITPLILLSLFVAGCTLLWGYLLLPRLGLVATGIGWLVSQALVCVLVICSFWYRSRHDRSTIAVNDDTKDPQS